MGQGAQARSARAFGVMDLNLLKVFEALFETRSVSLAADRLSLTQPAVSNALGRLRASFDDQLFVRTREGMEPTPLAMALSGPLLEGLASIRAGMALNIGFDPASSHRRFTLITTDVGEMSFVVEILRVLRREAPGIDLKVLEVGQQDYERLLDNGDADFALAGRGALFGLVPLRLADGQSLLFVLKLIGHSIARHAAIYERILLLALIRRR